MARSRGVLTIVQYEKHPITGEDLINEDVIIGGINGLKGIKKACWIYHSEDTFKESDVKKTRERLGKYYIDHQEDFLNEDGSVSLSMEAYINEKMETDYSFVKVGEKKPPHYHIVLLPKNDLDLETIAHIFGVPYHFVEANKRRKDGTTWYECIKYLTHRTTNAIKEKKFPYSSDKVVCYGFSYEEELEEYDRLIEKYGKALTEEEEIYLQVSNGEKSPLDVREEKRLFYLKNIDKLRKIHCDFLDTLPMPPFRLNIYVEGRGGEGKGQFIRYIAKSLSPTGTYFKVGGKNVTFEGYKGENVIVWEDFRGEEFANVFDHEEGKIMDYLDTFPDEDSKQREHIKFGSVNLVNSVNIINSVEPYENFLRSLVCETSDFSQSYRRFPMIIRIHEEDYDILMNSGFLKGTREFLQYEAYNHIRGGFAKIAFDCKKNIELRDNIFKIATEPVFDQIEVIKGKTSEQEMSDEEILEKYKGVGTFDFEKIEEEENHSKTLQAQEKEQVKQRENKKREQIEQACIERYLQEHSIEEIKNHQKEVEKSIDEMFSV